ncbi:dynein, cytoplasmic 1, intermediate chain 2a isoform X1 [Tachysurus ichikawai]
MSDKSELKAELERKKQRLAQIREEKKRKEEERKKKETEGRGEGASPPNDDSDLERKRRETEALLQSMGFTDPAMVQPLRIVTEDTCLFHYLVPPPMSPSAKSVGTPSETGSQDSVDGAAGTRTLHWDSDPSTLLLHSESQHGRGPLRLGMAKLTQVDFPPRELVSYSKETQTPVTTQPKDAEEENEEEDLAAAPAALETTQENEPHNDEEEVPPHELTEEEKQQILHSNDFLTFFDQSSRIVERALSEQVDVCFDYSGRDLQDKEGETQAGTKLSLNRQFTDERWSKHRVVTCLDWSPQDSLELVFKQSKPVAVTSMAFPLGDVNNFVVGSEDGTVYTACRHGSKAGISEMFEGHHGPVTGLDCHTATGPVDFSHLFVTSSFDWTVKLWSTRNTKPLYSFEDNSDYVYDVMWSPAHPALFACVDGVGHLDLWNLNNETEVPSASVTVEGNPALNRVRWANSGREVAVGDSEGRVHIYDVGEQIAVPRQDEWTSFLKTLSELGENQEEEEDLATQRLAA